MSEGQLWFFYIYPEERLIVATKHKTLSECSDDDIRIHPDSSPVAEIAQKTKPVKLNHAEFAQVVDRILKSTKFR